jgi:putative ABC transport system permease protein
MAILRAVGAHPWHIFLLLVLEAGAVAAVGAVLGLAAVQVGLGIAAPLVAERYGIPLAGIGFGPTDLAVLAGVLAGALLLGALPAWRAVRTALADGLTVRV